MSAAEIPTSFAALAPLDDNARWRDVASEMGAVGMFMTRADQLPDAIDEAIKADLSVIIDAKMDPAMMAPLEWGRGLFWDHPGRMSRAN